MEFHSRKIRKNYHGAFFIIAMLVLILFSLFPGAFEVFSSSANTIALPFWNISDSVKKMVSDDIAIVRFKTDLEKENGDLRKEMMKMQRELEGYNTVVEQNLELQKNLSSKKENGVFGGIIARPNITDYDTFLIDIGENAGIQKDDQVIMDDTIALGTVDEVYPHSAKVRLYSSAGRVTDILLGPQNVPVQIKGAGSGSFVSDLPQGLDIQAEDSAVMPGFFGVIIGYVKSVEKNPDISFQKIYLSSPVNIFEIKDVQVLKNQQP